ncbi:glucose-6-phosphate isomerase [Agromyces protaetiae]|uniref:glucose-6-phosphate isomerase n=1 Tax=Agromyces protaetiae TaxID=2509455 RepID=A0A4P6FD09_9MICO|nr:glucose-6-phosphate isomerase family protein [Agromyces protaetiae]QAY73735.1 glucose-6-phosphate isomerase [Agromyces protaetiae]
MADFAAPPLRPFSIRLDRSSLELLPAGPVLTRRLSDLEGLFADEAAWRADVDNGDPIVYTVASSPVPETATELPQSITRIRPGDVAGELYFTKGHMHPVAEGEIYLGLEGEGGLLLFDGTDIEFLEITPDRIGYIPPGWAHRSVNVGSNDDYSFLAVYPGGAGHDYGWVLEHGFGARVYAGAAGAELRSYPQPALTLG